ncbi:MAG: ABC transporter ATP-binding protein [Calditrichaceae bacterium]
MSVLDVRNIFKSFGDYNAVEDVSFTLDPGHIYGILGPNGAGKTTTLRMVMNILIPDSGSIQLFGEQMSDRLKGRIGYLPEERGLYPKMKVRQMLIFLAELHGLSAAVSARKTDFWLERFELSGYRDNPVQELSKGMQQKLQIAGSIIHDPELIIFDEPFSGLDPVNVILVKDIMLELKQQGKAIMLSTHMMDAAEKICDEILLINKGRKVLDGNLREIQKNYGNNSVHLEYKGDARFIKDLPFINKFNDFGNYVEVVLNDKHTTNDLLKEITDKIEVTGIQSQRSSLNEIFISVSHGGAKA